MLSCRQVGVAQSPELPDRLIDQLGASPSDISDLYAFLTQLEVSPLEQLSKDDISKALDLDPAISVTKQSVVQESH